MLSKSIGVDNHIFKFFGHEWLSIGSLLSAGPLLKIQHLIMGEDDRHIFRINKMLALISWFTVCKNEIITYGSYGRSRVKAS